MSALALHFARKSLFGFGAACAFVAACAAQTLDWSPDIVFTTSNPSSPTLEFWKMAGGTTLQTVVPNPSFVGSYGTVWNLSAIGDLDNDGCSDLVFQSSNSTGDLSVWFYRGPLGQTQVAPTPSNPGTSAWKLKCSADFTGLGTNDLVFQYSSGLVGIWYMTGDSQGTVPGQGVSTAYWSSALWSDANATSAAMLPPGWVIKGASSMNDAGVATLVLQYNGADWPNGLIGVWYCKYKSGPRGWDGTNYVSGSALFTPWTLPSAQWEIRAMGDFNGDGINDLLLHNTTTHALQEWILNPSLSATATNNLSTSPNGYAPAGIGEFNRFRNARAQMLSTRATANSITLDWRTFKSTNAQVYKRLYTGGDTVWTPLASVPAGTTTYTDYNVTQQTRYEYQVNDIYANRYALAGYNIPAPTSRGRVFVMYESGLTNYPGFNSQFAILQQDLAREGWSATPFPTYRHVENVTQSQWYNANYLLNAPNPACTSR